MACAGRGAPSGLLSHRGPDGHQQQLLADNRCLLGHNRLSIIDLEGGAQPLANEDHSVWVVCNGEIYNYIELREKLIAAGHSLSHAERLRSAGTSFRRQGKNLLNDLEGMFAFALFDTRRGELLLARDRFGEKPLYWASLADGGLAFASEMKALLSLPDMDLQLDIAAVAQFLALRYIPAPRTHMQGIRKLRAGESISMRRDADLVSTRFWSPDSHVNGDPRPLMFRLSRKPWKGFGSACGRPYEFACVVMFPSERFSLVESIPPLSPVPCGNFCRRRDSARSVRRSTTSNLNEAPFARQVAAQLDSDHHEVHFSSQELLPLFEDLIDHYDEPFADVSMFPTFAVCRAARQECKVMLSGDGGDECFAGYRQTFSYYRWHALRRTPGINHYGRTGTSSLSCRLARPGLAKFSSAG